MELDYFDEVIDVIDSLKSFNEDIRHCAQEIGNSLTGGGTLFIIGNGGSAADAQHIAAEIVGRYKEDRKGYRAIALTTDTSILTAISNDYSYSYIFKRQLESLAKSGDVLIAISTSGNSENVIQAIDYAKKAGILTISLTGKKGGKMKGMGHYEFIINSMDTGIIQISHSVLYHLLCSFVDKMLINTEKSKH